MTERRMQFSLDTAFLLVAAFSIVVAQLRVQHEQKAATEAWRRDLQDNNIVSPRNLRWDYAERTMGVFNIVGFCAGAYFFYRRSKRTGLWVGIGVTAIGTALATLIGAMGQAT
jgi:hypothetical protein